MTTFTPRPQDERTATARAALAEYDKEDPGTISRVNGDTGESYNVNRTAAKLADALRALLGDERKE